MDDGRIFGDGLAVGPDLRGAAEVATAEALAGFEGRAPDLLVVFVATGRGGDPDAAAAAAVRAMEMAGARAAIGTTAHGVIADGRGVEQEPSVSVFAAALPGVPLDTFRLGARRSSGGIEVTGTPPAAAAAAAEAAILLVDPFSFPVGGYLERSAELLPGLPLMGGLASVGAAPGGNRLVLDGEVLDGGAAGVLIGRGAGVRTVVSQGCRPIGPPMIVTAAEANLLLELAGEQAYAKLGAIVQALPPEERHQAAQALHLGVAMDEYADEHGRGDFLIRGVMGIDPEAGAVAVGDVVEVGRTVRFQVRDAAGAGEDLAHLLDDLPQVRGALLFSCNGRGAGMFPDADHDPRIVRTELGEIPVAGFFAAGEIGPVGGRNHLHSFTASVLAFE
ncbi:FIST signal transduction protein [Pseudonocardia halophobica]|uniref:FIST signal transduction protein n=1 Tax=Pseudonocardia halophobica TaxID=29401 RepID=UPI000B285813|nr:FIST N-terminal domain-containing protein [Pseudonocardia halophobica]